jgi:activating signal cointegrator 1
MIEPIRLLSLWNPWALLMAIGHKVIETRGWRSPYRGLIAIHAAKSKEAMEDADEILRDAGILSEEDTTEGGTDWHFGQIIAVVRLVDCVPTEEIRDKLGKKELELGNYSDGRFAWITTDLRRIKPGIPYTGAQGLRGLTLPGLRAIQERLPDLKLVA